MTVDTSWPFVPRDPIEDRDAGGRLRAIFEQTTVGIAEVDLEGRFVLVNDRYCEIVGRPREELVGHLRMQDITHPEDLTRNLELFGAMLEGGGNFAIEKRYLRPAGDDVWVRNSVSLIRDPDGAPRYVLAVSEDVTERVTAEMSTRESEARFRRIFETAGLSIWEEDFSRGKTLLDALRAEGVTDLRAYLDEHPEILREALRTIRVVDVNEHSVHLFEARDKEELLRSLEQTFVEESWTAFRDELVAIFEGRAMVTSDARMQTLRGNRRDVVVAMRIPTDEADFRSIPVALIDVTEQKRAASAAHAERERLLAAEQQARAEAEAARSRFVDLVQGLDAIVWEADARTFQFTFVSQRAEQILGYPVERWLEEPRFWPDHIHPDDRTWAVELCVDCTARVTDHEFEYRMLAADGRVVWLRDLVHVVPGPEGRARLLRGVMVDVTERRQAEEAREAFVGVLSHELRTPVTTILGAAELLLRRDPGRDDATQRALTEDVAAEARRLSRLVEDLLVLSRTERGQLVVDPEPVLLQHAIAAAITSESDRFPEVTFHAEVGPLPPVAADRTYAEQILRNLLSNAAKYGPDGPAQVVVRARQEGDRVVVRVLDEGPGFPIEERERLFELFYRATGARHRSGAGIGLYVTRALVEAMGGTVWAEPRVPRGSEFGLSLPVMTAAGFAGDRGNAPTRRLSVPAWSPDRAAGEGPDGGNGRPGRETVDSSQVATGGRD